MKDTHGMWSDMYMERVQLLLERGHEKSHWKSTWGIHMDCGVIQELMGAIVTWKRAFIMCTDCEVIQGLCSIVTWKSTLKEHMKNAQGLWSDTWTGWHPLFLWGPGCLLWWYKGMNNNWVLVMVMVMVMTVMMVLMVICTIYTSSSSLPWCSSQLRGAER